jgi:hypothetical protein
MDSWMVGRGVSRLITADRPWTENFKRTRVTEQETTLINVEWTQNGLKLNEHEIL